MAQPYQQDGVYLVLTKFQEHFANFNANSFLLSQLSYWIIIFILISIHSDPFSNYNSNLGLKKKYLSYNFMASKFPL